MQCSSIYSTSGFLSSSEGRAQRQKYHVDPLKGRNDIILHDYCSNKCMIFSYYATMKKIVTKNDACMKR